jgi:hypothetical protein
MNETGRLREAMRATEQAQRHQFDVELIMRKGRRLRYRRRAAQGGMLLASAAVVVGFALGLRPGGPPVEPGAEPTASATRPAGETARPDALDTPPPTPATPPPATPPTPVAPPTSAAPQPIGEPVTTGIRYGDDERVFYFVAVDLPHAPEVKVGLVAGRRSPDGALIADHLLNDVEGNDRRPGFHEIGYEPSDQVLPATAVPTFGYFVGPAAKIVGTVDGYEIIARQTLWSEEPEVVIFWFDPQSVTPGQRLDGIVAYDAQGRKL